MCGRYTLDVYLPDLLKLFELDAALGLKPRYNIAPSQKIPVVRVAQDDTREMVAMRWGLVPSWSQDVRIGYKLINARSETVAEKPSFRSAFRKRRCLIPATGFYEWQPVAGQKRKRPYLIRMKSQKPFAFAGLWEAWTRGPQPLQSCTIVTTAANPVLMPIHKRMPVILHPTEFEGWLKGDEALAQALMRPYPGSEMEAFAVSTLVNKPGNDVIECVQPVQMQVSANA